MRAQKSSYCLKVKEKRTKFCQQRRHLISIFVFSSGYCKATPQRSQKVCQFPKFNLVTQKSWEMLAWAMLQCIPPAPQGSTLFHLCAPREKIKVNYEQGYSPIKLLLKELCSQLRTFSFSFLHLIFSATYFSYYSSHFTSIWFQLLIRNLEVQL